jgi:hypothetical protein
MVVRFYGMAVCRDHLGSGLPIVFMTDTQGNAIILIHSVLVNGGNYKRFDIRG